jgi:hypothetical protein
VRCTTVGFASVESRIAGEVRIPCVVPDPLDSLVPPGLGDVHWHTTWEDNGMLDRIMHAQRLSIFLDFFPGGSCLPTRQRRVIKLDSVTDSRNNKSKDIDRYSMVVLSGPRSWTHAT